MKYVNGDVYFRRKKTDIFPYINDDYETNICIIGGGFSGLLSAYYLSENNTDITVVEKNLIGYGISLGINGVVLIDYEKLAFKKMRDEITRLFELYKSSKESLKMILNETGTKYSEFDRYEYVNKIMQKGNLQKHMDFLENVYNIKGDILQNVDKINALLVSKIDDKVITFNSSEFINNLASFLVEKRGVKIFENSDIIDVKPNYEHVNLTTKNGFKIEAEKVIYATGMNIQNIIDVNLSTYQKFHVLLEKKQELKEKKKYLENFNDSSETIVINEDTSVCLSGEETRVNMKMLDEKYSKNIEKEKYAKLVIMANKVIDFDEYTNKGRCYSNIVGKTFDMLPIIDEIECMPNCFAVASFGTNTILNGIIAGKIFKNAVNGLFTKEIRFFRMNREGCINK